MTSTLLAKDTSHRTVFSVFGANGAPGLPTAQGAGNIMMVADPTTFRVLPWAERTGWVLCDLYLANGEPVPVSTRALHRAALARLAKAGFAYMAGLEVEFHLFRVEDPRLAPATLTWPAEPPAVSHTTRGYHYLTEAPIDAGRRRSCRSCAARWSGSGCRSARSRWSSGRASSSSPSRRRPAWRRPTPWCCCAAP